MGLMIKHIKNQYYRKPSSFELAILIPTLKRLSNNPKLEEKERQIEPQIQKEAKFLAPKAIAGQPLK